jgi:ABC-type sugar transport system permease subunit
MYEICRLSFSRVDLATLGAKFVGLANYKDIFTDEVFRRATKNMMIWIGVYVPAHFLLGLLAALALNLKKLKWTGKILRVAIFAPWTVSLISTALSWQWLLQTDYGLVNSFLKRAGLGGLTRSWLSDPSLALYSLMIVNTWWRYPFVMLVLISGLQTVPEDLISAARIDGANGIQILFYVILPWLKILISLTLVLSLIYALQAFTTIWVLTGGGPAHYTELYSTLIYRTCFTNLDWAGASVISVILFVVSSAVIIPYVYLSTKKV